MSVLVGRKAPLFNAPAVVDGNRIVPDFQLESLIGSQTIVLYFYPKDFSGICPKELLAFQQQLPEFEKRNCAVLACSTDSDVSHKAWLNTPVADGGIQGVTYPLISDFTKTITAQYGSWRRIRLQRSGHLICDGPMIPYRGLFIIDKNGLVQHQVVNFFTLVRSVKDALRMVDTLHRFQEQGEVCEVEL
ncbi:MAG: peroxiredoxin [Sphingobacteriia bacterium]|nr:peroxiredoxin [Sphingobacteriia bacterium]